MTEKILYPVNNWQKGLSQSRLSEWGSRDAWPRSQVQHLQRRALRDLLVYADLHCPFYRQRFADNGVNPKGDDPYREIQKLPLLTKSEIRASIDTLFADAFRGHTNLTRKATGGSTGVPLEIWGDREDYQLNGLVIARQRAWIGWHGGMETISLFGGFRDLPSAFRRTAKRWLINDTLINNMARENGDYDRLAARLLKKPPQALIGYFSSLRELASALERAGEPLAYIQLAIACAEPLDERARRHAEKWLGTPIYFQYGCRELGTFAQECRLQQGYHYAEDLAYCEVLDDQGHATERGNLTITYLGNKVVPLIRYQVGDVAVLETTPCPCGLPYGRLKVIEGRTSAVLQTPGGARLTGMVFPHVFKDYPWIAQFQVEQPELNRLVLRIRRGGNSFSDASKKDLEQKLLGLIGKDMLLDWRYDEPFVQVPTGKHLYFISRL